MTQTASQLLEPHPLAASRARAFVTDACRRWGLADVIDTVVLLTSELVTNGVLHARTELAVTVSADDDDRVVVEVQDHDRRPPMPRGRRVDLMADIDSLLLDCDRAHDVDERHHLMAVGPAGSIGAGRGLLLVETLADEWGVEQHADGKGVWFRIDSAGEPNRA